MRVKSSAGWKPLPVCAVKVVIIYLFALLPWGITFGIPYIVMLEDDSYGSGALDGIVMFYVWSYAALIGAVLAFILSLVYLNLLKKAASRGDKSSLRIYTTAFLSTLAMNAFTTVFTLALARGSLNLSQLLGLLFLVILVWQFVVFLRVLIAETGSPLPERARQSLVCYVEMAAAWNTRAPVTARAGSLVFVIFALYAYVQMNLAYKWEHTPYITVSYHFGTEPEKSIRVYDEDGELFHHLGNERYGSLWIAYDVDAAGVISNVRVLDSSGNLQLAEEVLTHATHDHKHMHDAGMNIHKSINFYF